MGGLKTAIPGQDASYQIPRFRLEYRLFRRASAAHRNFHQQLRKTRVPAFVSLKKEQL